MNTNKWILGCILLFAAVLSSCKSDSTTQPTNALQITTTKIGNPTWSPTDMHVISAPIGTAASNYVEGLLTTSKLLPPPNHVIDTPALGIGPGAAHKPPYDWELLAGIVANHFHEVFDFDTTEFSKGKGVFLVWMNVPNPGTTGRSPDSVSGPIIPNNLFPFHVSGLSLRNNARNDTTLVSTDVPKLNDTLEHRFNGMAGHSHFPFFVYDNADFNTGGASVAGNYVYKLDIKDVNGNGWHIEAPFKVR